MMEQKITKMNNWFEEKIAACGSREKELQADDRKDEAVFEKVKANIYDAMRTWLAVGVRIVGNGTRTRRRTSLSPGWSRFRPAGPLPMKRPRSMVTRPGCRRSRSSWM